ncbi:MAG: hypothetical protein IJH41_06355 [Eubacterium sp.]|nr:hypothetical protein [Eubacterium sp.]
MSDSPFRVIKGGLDGQPADSVEEQKPYIFVSAWVTDTRLMGVNAMCIRWKDRLDTDLHQYFYFDAVDTGFERFDEVSGNDEDALREKEISYAGGLGGRKVNLDEDEALYLIQDFIKVNKRTGEPVPKITIRLKKMLQKKIVLDDGRRETLMQKVCKEPLSLNEKINYFMMRICDSDDDGIRFLSGGKLGREQSPCRGTLYTLHSNQISYTNKNNAVCRSLVESDQRYELWISELTISAGNIASYKRTSRMKISDTEAYMALSHSEYIMVYEMAEDAETLTQDSTPFTRRSSLVEEEDGTSFMLFRPNNNHVDTRDYKLYDDIFGIYHITSTRQFICSSGSQRDLAMMELDLVFSPIYKSLSLIGNYELNEPVMAQFLSSGYDDFNDFLKQITRPTE